MRLLDRYLLRELLIPLGYCLSGFLIFWIAFDLFSELHGMQEKHLWASDIAEYYLAVTPGFLVVVLPVALLLALLYTLTNLARHHEIVAMRAAGVSLWRLCLPYLVVGFVLSLLLFALNELWVPASAEQAERILNRRQRPGNSAEQSFVPAPGMANLAEGRLWLAGSYNPKTSEMRSPLVIWTLADGSQRWLFADRAIRTNGAWTFFDVREYKAAGQTNPTPEPILQTNALTMREFTETPERIQSQINISKGMSIRNRNKADIPISQILDYLSWDSHPSDPVKSWLYTKLYGRLAAPWTCLVVVLIAIPFGAASGRRNAFVGVAGSIFICFVYFVLMQLGLALGTGSYLPAWLAAWFPNLTFGIAGLWLTARVR
jgi:lipopolysaccharide export system permease protein